MVKEDKELPKINITPFHLFAKHGLVEPIKFCYKLGIPKDFRTKVSYKDYPSATVLHLATAFSQIDLC